LLVQLQETHVAAPIAVENRRSAVLGDIDPVALALLRAPVPKVNMEKPMKTYFYILVAHGEEISWVAPSVTSSFMFVRWSNG
jgi:hypothetical protein